MFGRVKLTEMEKHYCSSLTYHIMAEYSDFDVIGYDKINKIVCSDYRLLKEVNKQEHVDITVLNVSTLLKQIKGLESHYLELQSYTVKKEYIILSLHDFRYNRDREIKINRFK